MTDVIFWSIFVIFSIGLLIYFSDWFVRLVKHIERNRKRKEKIIGMINRYYFKVFDIIIKKDIVLIDTHEKYLNFGKNASDLKQELELNFDVKVVILSLKKVV
jgi:hypothetical protein